MLAAMAVMFLGMGGVIVWLCHGVYQNYKRLQVADCRSAVDFQAERINKNIRELQERARSLALCAFGYYNAPVKDRELAEIEVQSHFTEGSVAVGGGIWFEPGKIEPGQRLWCIYSFNDGMDVLIAKSFESEQYNYLGQMWYKSVREQLKGVRDIAWTPPYFDDEGTKALMTTAGAGIYDRDWNFVGMSTVDWKLDSMARDTARIRPTENSFSLFADARHDYILALNDRNVGGDPLGKSLSTLPWYVADAGEESEFDYAGERYISFRRELDNGMAIVVNVPEDELFAAVYASLWSTVAAFFGACFLLSLLTYLLQEWLVSRPIKYLSQKADEIGRGNFDAEIRLERNDELGTLAAAIGTMARNIKTHISELRDVTAEKQRIATELDLARNIQSSILPSIFPPYPEKEEFDIYAKMVPAKEVGGDFFDFFLVDEKHLAVVVADVSDKGVPAALFMMIAKTLVKNFAQLGLPAGEVFGRANRQLCEHNDAGMFVTAFMGILEIDTGVFSYVNAGHNPPCVSRSGGAFEMLDVPPGFVLAGMEDSMYAEKTTRLAPGDRLFLYTDGVVEACDRSNELFGDDRMIAALNGCGAKSDDIQALVHHLGSAVADFANGARQSDDITLLGLVYLGGAGQK